MNFQSIKAMIAGEPKGSFDDAAVRRKDLVQIITSESFDVSHVTRAIRRSRNKVTDQLVEQYSAAASSKELTSDEVVLEILENSQFKIGNKYIFTLDDEAIAIRKEMIPESIGDLDQVKDSIRRKLYG